MAARYGTIVRHLVDDPVTAVELAGALPDEVLFHLAEAIADEQRRRAAAHGDEAAVIDHAFDVGFGADGLGAHPWIAGPYVVCPGSIVVSSRSRHRCRFVSVDDTWVWESPLLVVEEKRSSPGSRDGFRAVALLPVVQGTALDVVTGTMRAGRHRVEHVVSWQVRRGSLVEVGQRSVRASGMQ